MLVRRADQVQQQSVIKSLRCSIFDRDIAFQSVPGSGETRPDCFRHQEVAAGEHLNVGLKLLDDERAGVGEGASVRQKPGEEQ